MDKPATSRILSVFDLDGTLTAGRSVENTFIQYLVRTRRISPENMLQTLIFYLKNILRDPVEAVKRNKLYLKGTHVREVAEWISEFMASHGNRLLLPGAVDFVSGHRTLGHTLILITGAPDIIVEKLPIRKFFDIVYATRLETYNHSYSGRIDGPHYYGTIKAGLVKRLSGELNAALENSYCYADSREDIAMMSLFGNPVAVRPDRGLKRVAEKSHWKIIPA